MKEREISIENVMLKIGNREVALTLAEAKKLKGALDELFGKQIIHEHHNGWWWGYSNIPCTMTKGVDAPATFTVTNDAYTVSNANVVAACNTATVLDGSVPCTLTGNTLTMEV